MFKKVVSSFLFIIMFFCSFSMFSDAFSQPNIVLKSIRNNGKIYIRILTPTNVKMVNAYISSNEGQTKAIVNKDYYGVINENGIEYNEFVISNNNTNFTEDDRIKVISGYTSKTEELVSAIPYDIITKGYSTEKKELRVMTFNMHHGKDKAGNDRFELIKELIKQHNPDIIALQEVDKNATRTNFRNQLKELGDKLSMHYYFGPNRSILKGEYGNGILSKYPIIDTQNIKLQGKETRGLLRCVVLVDDLRVNVFVTHLGLDAEERIKQFNVIKDYIDIYEDNLIMAGDFNSLASDPNIIYLQNRLNDTGDKTINSYQNTLNVFRNNLRIDYIFLNKDVKIKRYKLEKVDYSDHFPIFVDIEI